MNITHESKLYLPMQPCTCEREGCNGMVPLGKLIFAQESVAEEAVRMYPRLFSTEVQQLELSLYLDNLERYLALAKLTEREKQLLGVKG